MRFFLYDGNVVDAVINGIGVGSHKSFYIGSADENVLFKDDGNIGHVLAEDFVNLVDKLFLVFGILFSPQLL